MATSFTSLLGLALPVTGELAGTWGDVVNNSITTLLDSAVAGTTTLSTDADVTLTTTTGSTNQSRQAILLCSGARTLLRTITAPAQSKMYVVINSTTGGFGVKIVGVGPTTGVTVANGKTAIVVWNGADFVEVAPAVATNLSGGVAGSLPYQTAASTTTFLGIGANNTVLTSNGTAPGWTASTGTGTIVRASAPTIVTPTFTTSATVPLVIGGTGTTSTLALRSTSGVGTTGADIIFQVGNNGATEAMRVLNSGNVGVKTTTPNAPLEVSGGAMRISSINTTSTNTALTIGSYQSSASTTYGANIRVYHNFGGGGASDMAFETGGITERMRITNAGDVGIGTTTPAVRLQLTNAGTTAGEILRVGNIAGGTWGGIGFESLAPRYPVVLFGGDLSFKTGSSTYASATERMVIDASGNVGIGTTNPTTFVQAAKSQNADVGLSVLNANTGTAASASSQVGSDSATLVMAAYGSGFTGTGPGNANATALFTSGATTGGLVIGARNAAGVIRFTTGGDTERMRLDSAGNLGIGTSTPGVKLAVVTTSTALSSTDGASTSTTATTAAIQNTSATTDTYTELAFTSGTPSAQVAYIRSIRAASGFSPALAFLQRTGSTAITESMRIDSAGNVGIGATSASFRLDVTSADATGTIAAFRSTGAATSLITFADTAPTNVGPRIGSAGNNLVILTNSTGSAAERMRIDSAGLVGIGTVTPFRPLHIASTNATAFFDRDGGNPAAISFRGSRGSLAAPTQTLANDTLGVVNAFGYTNAAAYSSAGRAALWFYAAENFTSAAQGAYLTLETTPTGTAIAAERMRITAAGDVGIGTATPLLKLDVVGATNNGAITQVAIFRQISTQSAGSGAEIVLSANDITRAVALAGVVDVGNGHAMLFKTSTNGATPTERMRIDSVGKVLVGATTARANYNNATFSPRMQIEGVDSTGSSLAITCNNSSDADGPILYFGKSATSTVGSNTLVANNELLGIVAFAGNDGTEFVTAAQIKAEVDGAPGVNDMPGRLVFSTASDGASAVTERMRIDSVGNVLVTGAGGLGYGTGSGGAVTQTVSRTSGVTLNKTNGAITLVSAAGTATWQSFTVTNSTVAATDTIVVSQKSGTDLYMVQVTAVAATSFRITFATTGGTTTEQPVFNFAVIKAVAA